MAQQTFEPLRARTFAFAVEIVRFCRTLPRTLEGRRVGDQLFRAGTSVSANYRAAGRGRSDSEFISKMGTVVEEADESCFWLQLIKEADIKCGATLDKLLDEADQLLRIFSASLTTAKANRAQRRAEKKSRRRAGRQTK